MSDRDFQGLASGEGPEATSRLPSRQQSVTETITRASSVFCMVAGCVVLCGWLLDIPLLKSISPEWVTMKANTAVCLILAGASLWMLREEHVSPRRLLLGKTFAAIIALVGALTLAEYAFRADFGIDLFNGASLEDAFAPGRMSSVTAICLVLFGLALLGLDWKTRRGRRPSLTLPLITAIASLFAVTGYVYGARPVYDAIAVISPMALHTAVSFIILSLGVLCARPDRGLTGVLTGAGVGSFMARRLLPVAMGLPVFLGWLRQKGQESGFYTTELGVALLVTALVVVLAVVFWRTAVLLNHGEIARNTARKQAEEERSRFFAISRDLLCTVGFDGYFKDLNPAWETTLGYTKAELLARPFIDFIHPDDRPATLAEEAKVTAGKAVLAFENRYRCKDGSYRSFVWSATPVIEDRLIYGAARDVTERRQAEEALLKAGALQTAIFNSATFSCIATDAKGVIQLFNVGAERMLGYMAAEVVNRITPADLHDPQEVIARAAALSIELATPIAPGFEALVFKAARGIEDIYEVTQVRKDGSRLPAVLSVTALRDGEGTIIGYLLIGTDNTARQQVEEERKRLDQRLRDQQFYTRSLIESNIDPLITTDPVGIISDVNKQMETLTGCTRDELIGAPFKDYFTDPERAEAGIKQVLSEQKVTNYELTARARDGRETVVSYNATTFYDRGRRLQGVFAAARDITDRKQVEDALRGSEERCRAFLTASSDVVYRMSADWSEMRQLDGRNFLQDTKEASGTWFQEYIHPDDQPRVKAVIDEAIRTKSTFEMEHRVRRVDGTLGWTFSRAIPLPDAKGEIVEWFGAASDVTERKLFEQTLRLKNVELEDANRMKSEFLANMSHELRTPLNSIIGFSEVLRDGLIGELSDQQRGFIGDIFSSGNHLLSLINDILDLSKVEAGKMVLELEPVQVPSLLASSLSIVREKAATRRIRLDMNAAEDLGAIQMDARKVKQIVYNLLSNAVKFTADGGQVTLGASRVPRAEVGQLSGSWTGRSLPLADNDFPEFLQISVTDSGIGIAPDGLEYLFKPFSQIDSGLARKFEGTGLGLAMVKLLAELHGGAVAVESAVGEGSCFTVWLPLRAPEQRALTSAKAPASPRIEALGTRTALVVEDDFKAADLIRVQLEAEGFEVLHAASAEAALALALQQPLALITLDMMLPNMDGWEFLSRLKQVPDLRRIPVVIISIVADSNKGFALGAAAVMQKPITRHELYESLLDLGLFPVSPGHTLKVLIVDDDPKAVELIAVQILGLAGTVHRAYGGREAIENAQRELPDLIVLDLMMPEVNGFDVAETLKLHPDTAGIPILVVTAKVITTEDRARLSGYVATIMEKTEFDPDQFTAEVRRAMSGRQVVT